MTQAGSSKMKVFAWGLIIILALVHYDFWYWDDQSLVFGFMPIGLFFHADDLAVRKHRLGAGRQVCLA